VADDDRVGGAHRSTDAWADALQRLIGAGHAYTSILNYTLAQTDAFIAAIDRQESRRLANLLTVVSVGSQGGSDAIKKVLKGLDA